MQYALRRFAGRTLLACFALVLAPAAALPAAAGNLDHRGTDFWVAFPTNSTTAAALRLFIASETATSGTVEIPAIGFSTPFAVAGGAVATVIVPSTGVNSAHLAAADGLESKGVHVTALAEVAVYGLNNISGTTDGYLALPTDLLDTDYLVMSYQSSFQGSEFAIVGTVDDTIVWITPSVTTGSRAGGIPYSMTIDRGQTYQLRNLDNPTGDLTGTIISATDHPIAVFSGHQCTNVPPATAACDHLVEQLPPVDRWGREFVTVPLRSRLNGDTFRFLASEDDTDVYVHGSLVATLDRGEFHEQLLTTAAHVTADRPILVAQYANGDQFDASAGIGDPFMMLIPPTTQFDTSFRVMNATFGSVSFTRNFLNVVAPTGAVGAITRDGIAIPAADFSPIGSSGYSGAQLMVSAGPHHLNGPMPFGVSVYGFSIFDSYGYPGGVSLAPRPTTITVSQETPVNRVGTPHCVVATVLDQFGEPMEGVSVDFIVTGPNGTAGVAVTDSGGRAEFCYTGLTVGDDTIQASAGIVVSNELVKTWFDNAPPDLTNAAPTQACFWPPKHKFVTVGIVGIIDPDGDPVTITITDITSDEPTATAKGAGGKKKAPDASGIGTDTASIRAERSGKGDGRVYEIFFDASDGQETVSGSVTVGIAHDKRSTVCGVDSGQEYDATTVN